MSPTLCFLVLFTAIVLGILRRAHLYQARLDPLLGHFNLLRRHYQSPQKLATFCSASIHEILVNNCLSTSIMASGGSPGSHILSTASESLYGELQDAGSLLQKAIVDPNQPCLIRRSTLTFKDLGHWNSEEFWEGPPDNVKDKVTSMLLSNDDLGYQLTSMSAGEDYWGRANSTRRTVHRGHVSRF